MCVSVCVPAGSCCACVCVRSYYCYECFYNVLTLVYAPGLPLSQVPAMLTPRYMDGHATHIGVTERVAMETSVRWYRKYSMIEWSMIECYVYQWKESVGLSAERLNDKEIEGLNPGRTFRVPFRVYPFQLPPLWMQKCSFFIDCCSSAKM